MRSPVYGLVWEQWRQVRLPIVFALVGTFATSLTVHKLFEYLVAMQANPVWRISDSRNWTEISIIVTGFCMVLVMAALVFTHSSARDLRMGVPQRMLLLPITPLQIALTQVLFRFVTVGLVAWVIGLSLALIDVSFRPQIANIAGVSLVVYAYASAVASTLGKRYPIVAFVAVIVTLSPVVATIVKIDEVTLESVGHLAVIVFVFLCGVVSIVSTARLRSTLPVQVLLIPRERTYRSVHVVSKRETFTFEWRRIGWMFPCFTAGLAVAMGIPSFLWSPHQFIFPDRLAEVLSALLVYSPPVVAFIVGMILLAREHRDSLTGLARFTWTRPVTVQDVVLRRMKVITESMILTCIAIAVLAGFSIFLSGELSSIRAGEIVFGLAGYAAILIGAWCILWVPYLPVAYWVVFILYVSVVSTDQWGLKENFFLVWIPEGVFFFVLAALAKYCWKRSLFESRVVIRFCSFCGLFFVSATITLIVYDIGSSMDWAFSQYMPTTLALSFVPLFSLLSQGTFLDHVRHGALFRKLPARNS